MKGPCYHVPGVTCSNCMSIIPPEYMPMYLANYQSTYPEPVKCPDCGTWWRTLTHRCGSEGGKP